MSEIILKERLNGYYYINASKEDKQVFVFFQFNETESYIFNFIFPKCGVSYVFFFENPDDNNQLYISTKAALNLADAMDQPNFSLRKPMIAILVGDQTRKSINFITNDASDQTLSNDLFNSSCKTTEFEKHAELVVRQAILDRNAGTNLTLWIVDGPMVGTYNLLFNCFEPFAGKFISPSDEEVANIDRPTVIAICGGKNLVDFIVSIFNAQSNKLGGTISQTLITDFKKDINSNSVSSISFTVISA